MRIITYLDLKLTSARKLVTRWFHRGTVLALKAFGTITKVVPLCVDAGGTVLARVRIAEVCVRL